LRAFTLGLDLLGLRHGRLVDVLWLVAGGHKSPQLAWRCNG